MTESVDRQEVRITKLGHPVDIVYKAMPLDTHAERVYAELPLDMCTDGGTGDFRRLRVDVGQTSFFAGREFRTFREFTIPNGGAPEVIAVTNNVNTILQDLQVEIFAGAMRLEIVVGGTFTPGVNIPLPIIKTNTMTTASTYAAQNTVVFGGSLIGGTVIDVFKIDANKNQVTPPTFDASDKPFGLAPGTYYFRFSETNSAAVPVLFKIRWEERP
jgi:hypothetical protein